MDFKTGEKVIFCEEEYEVIRVDDSKDTDLDLLIEDNAGYTLWVNHNAVRRAE